MLDQEKIDEIYELVKENNKFLRAERRGRIYAGILKIIWWSVLIAAPLWFYYNYVVPVFDNMQSSAAQLEGLMRVQPQLKEQLGPIVDSIKTINNLFTNSEAN